MSLVSIVMLLPISILGPASGRLFQYTAKKEATVRSEMSDVAEEVISNIRTVKAFASEEKVIKSFKDKSRASFGIGRTIGIYKAWTDGFWAWFFIGAWVG